MNAGRRFDFVVDARDAGDRLDRVCAARLAGEGISRSSIEPLFGTERARLNGRTAKASTRVSEGDRVELDVPPPEAPSAEPEDIAIRVLFEDDHLLVVDKPAGLVVHPAKGHASGTLVNAVLHHAALESDDERDDGGDARDALRPGIVHRLDKDTSGVMVIAKSVKAREGLKSQFQAHTIEREYIALTTGVPPDGITYDTLHGRHPTDRKRFTSKVSEGKRAVTTVRLLETLARGDAALVACRLKTGRTHQIRMHLAEHGHPILGDAVYGRPPRDATLKSAAAAVGHQALHARLLAFVHPATGERVECRSEPPPEFASALEILRRANIAPR